MPGKGRKRLIAPEAIGFNRNLLERGRIQAYKDDTAAREAG